jgi:hypothetical protein
MRISVGISGSAADQDVLAWCAQYAQHGDQVTLVHVCEQHSAVKYGWLRATKFNSYRHQQAAELLAAAEREFVSKLTARAIPTQISALGGVVGDMLVHESRRADVLVVGAGHDEWPSFLREIGCPVVVVPAGWDTDIRRGRNVAVLCGREVSAAAMDLAVDHARRTRMAVLVIQPSLAESATDDGGTARSDLEEIAQAEQLDMEVASWSGPGAPPIVTEVRHDAPLDQLRALASTLGVVVLPIESGRADADASGPPPSIRAVVGELGLPVLLVPGASAADGPNGLSEAPPTRDSTPVPV